MIERWAVPVIPIGIEESGKVLRIGEIQYDFTCFILKEEDVERIRLGYVCLKCLEPHPKPFPERCLLCGFPMQLLQEQVFEHMYGGEVRVGPRTTLEEEMEIAKEMVERDRR
jgi:hypothetical protein